MTIPHILRSVALGALALLAMPAVASAGPALVDDPADLSRIPAEAQAYFDRCEAEYQAWLKNKQAAKAQATESLALAAPHAFLATTSHKQIRSDFCGPATTTIIDHFLRGPDNHWTQRQWAAYKYNGVPLWTDAGGGNMWVIAMGLKAKTGRNFAYTAGNTLTSVYNRTEYSHLNYRRGVAYGVRIYGDPWPYYQYDHRGHIVCGRGFDWDDKGKIFLDDSYPEREYQQGGGDTYGKRTYPKLVVAQGVVDSDNNQLIY